MLKAVSLPVFALLFVLPLNLSSQNMATAAPAASLQQSVSQLDTALTGSWTGVLEYRDYQSDKHVKLPTWLEISAAKGGLSFRYVYDDGPTKTVVEEQVVSIDGGAATWTITSADAKDSKDKPSVDSISGLGELKNGRGTLVLTGTGIDNNRKADVRTTVHVGRNILEILRETKAPGEEFKFRHSYTFTRATAPALQATH